MARHPLPVLPNEPDPLAETLAPLERPLCLFGAPGRGKSTLAARLARALAPRASAPLFCLGADPGSPAFGLPGALTLARWENDAWLPVRFEALCSLDAGRFRLPLIQALETLSPLAAAGWLLVDAPGLVRGTAARELVAGLCQALGAPDVLLLAHADESLPLADELRARAHRVWRVPPAPEARRTGRRMRARQRTRIWDDWLRASERRVLPFDALPVLGNPPPVQRPESWQGRQFALLRHGRTLTLGEIESLRENRLVVRVPATATDEADALLVRDAQRREDGLLGSAEPFASPQPVSVQALLPIETPPSSPPLAGRCGPLDFTLVNGVFGDPLLHLRLRHAGRSLLFDLGEAPRLSARLAHQITDVFVSHAHMDHLGGFQWLLRSRLGDFPACRLYGPPGLADHVACFIDSFLWDRIGTNGPAFVVNELHGTTLRRWRIQAGIGERTELAPCEVHEGVIHQEAGFRIRALELDHHTPVLAFAFEPERELHVRKDRLREAGLEPGPWLGELKAAIIAERRERSIVLPDGNHRPAGELAEALLMIRPGKRLVYATDLADHATNRQRLATFARGAHTFFCEAPFRMRDSDHAARNGHLTTRACAEIAREACVARLAPFHFSRRYQDDPESVYEEIQAVFPVLVRP